MTIDHLTVIVTLVGAALFATIFLFVVGGNKLPPEAGRPQTIRYKGIELSTNQVGFLAVIFAILTGGPFAGRVWLKSKEDDLARESSGKVTDQLSACTSERDRIKAILDRVRRITIVGNVTNDGKAASLKRLANAEGYLVRLTENDPSKRECVRRLSRGSYQCALELRDDQLSDVFSIRIGVRDDEVGKSTPFSIVDHSLPIELRDIQ